MKKEYAFWAGHSWREPAAVEMLLNFPPERILRLFPGLHSLCSAKASSTVLGNSA